MSINNAMEKDNLAKQQHIRYISNGLCIINGHAAAPIYI